MRKKQATKNKKNEYQQGDVLLNEISTLPDNVRECTEKEVILQKGEFTGHAHRIEDPSKVNFFLATDHQEEVEGRITPFMKKYLRVLEEVNLRHEEHGPIPLAPGLYEVDIVREYDYDKNETRRVED